MTGLFSHRRKKKFIICDHEKMTLSLVSSAVFPSTGPQWRVLRTRLLSRGTVMPAYFPSLLFHHYSDTPCFNPRNSVRAWDVMAIYSEGK